jgi:hypothetical protein
MIFGHFMLHCNNDQVTATMMNAAKYSAVNFMRDGRQMEIRALKADDRADLLGAVKRTSTQSLYRRFFVSGSPPPPCNARPDRHDVAHIRDVESHIWLTI